MNRIIGMVKQLLSKLIPPIYRQDPSVKRRIYQWLLIGLLIRFFFMPITVHGDLLNIYYRSSFIAYQGVRWLEFSPLLTTYLHAFFLWIFKPLMPYMVSIFGTKGYGLPIIVHPYVFRTLFLFKVPYLLFDLGCAFLLLAILQDKRKGLAAFIFWMVNPVVILATYFWSRYESVAIFFILLGLYYARRSFPAKSLFCLGVSSIVRLYPLILLPFFVIILGKRLRQRLGLAFWGILPLGITTILPRLFHRVGEAEKLTKIYHTNYLLAMKFYLGYLYDNIYIFPLGATVVLLYAYFNTDHSFMSLWKTTLILLLVFFATCFFHPQYFMWLMPFLALQVVENKKFIGLFIGQVLCFMVYTFQFGSHAAGFFFTPLNFGYFSRVATPFEIINRYYPTANFIGIFRSLFSAICLWMVYLVLRELSRAKEVHLRG